MTSQLAHIFTKPNLIDGVFCKILTRNDDSGRHGILIPGDAYKLFPEITGFVPGIAENYTESITTLWQTDTEEHINLWEKAFVVEARASFFKHYHRYPERRITSLRSKKLDAAPPNSLFLTGRRKDQPRTYECFVFYPDEPEYQLLIKECGFSSISQGLFFFNDEWSISSTITISSSLNELLAMFDEVSKQEYIQTLRAGDTGVGYTLETLLGIPENNDRTADYKGIEIKSYRSEELTMERAEKMNLFLLEPRWIDGIRSQVERIKKYGYFDNLLGRFAWYSTVKIQPNSHGLAFAISNSDRRLYLTWNATPVAYYKYEAIEQRLQEKHRETVFIAASTRGKGENEMFHYRTFTYCVGASVKSFLSLLENGSVMLEIRMHVESKEKARNHGSAFRINENKLPDLFSTVTNLRGQIR